MKRKAVSEYYDVQISFNHFIHTDMEWKGFGAQFHNVFEIIYVKDGSLTYVVDEKIYNVESNSLIITRPGKTHVVQFNKSDYERYDIMFNPAIIHPDVYNQLPESLDVISLENPSSVLEMLEKMDIFCKHFSGDALKKILTNIIEELFFYILTIANTPSSEILLNDYKTVSILTKSIEYIDQNLTNPFNLDQMCRELFISKSYLHKIFLHHLQTTPKKYIISKRLALARIELQSSAKPTEIYSRCGFTDYSSFYRCYVQHFGYPPSKESEKKIITIEK